MKIIKELVEMIEEELEGAENYALCALKYKEEHPALANVLYEISTQEMRHVTILHDEVTKVIKAHRDKHGAPPVAMQSVYDWQHEKQIEQAKEIKILQNQFRENS